MEKKVKPILIELKPEDFNKEGIYDQYSCNIDCPLGRASKRRFRKWCTVGVDLSIWSGRPYTSIKLKSFSVEYEDWNLRIACKVRRCYAQGDTTVYYVPVYPINY